MRLGGVWGLGGGTWLGEAPSCWLRVQLAAGAACVITPGCCTLRLPQLKPGLLHASPLPMSAAALLAAQTVCGGRLLKTSILQPFTHISTINARLDALQVGGGDLRSHLHYYTPACLLDASVG